ncbi:gliding motility-associated C-terminal domain-containing protein [Pedobacter agri]|uniref:Gliding motility-associated C-terminal domain-containing protein n=1 Tax=Pedobacter agri TaxID=454586 RepID=A0A9X3DD15_9SPHI|nr:gliding motility-associated C-terminal domain-containing protein [Pedobacter agri]MCX3265367.1 gliding motility-associated C-terminal domain-containing protein [Pedobacter agri]
MSNKLLLLLCVAILAASSKLVGQTCPENIGFENGNFRNWKLFTGLTTLYSNKNVIYTNEVASPAPGRHSIITNKAEKDYYGGFDLIPKNGGNFSVKLGNNGTGAQVDGVSYLLNVPSDRPEFTLTYQYAVVLEDPSHPLEEQPRFIARVKDLEKNEYIPCASFEYVATSSLPGFKKSKVNASIIYKEWTPVTINLSGYQGKQLLIEFISADCALGGHFGYAYVDVDNLCGDLVVGNTFCKSADELNISGPSGFQFYNWYNADKSVKYGSGQSINIKPTPPEGSKIILDLVPYAGFGCPSSITSVVHSVDYHMQVLEKNTVCQNAEIDLTASNYILNKSDQFTYLVYQDKDLTQQLTGLVKIQQNTKFYIKATNFKGCESVATIDINVFDLANATVKSPLIACFDQTVDITNDQLYSSLEGISRSYFTDDKASKPLSNPNAVKTSGTYYVLLGNNYGCNKILPVQVIISPKPLLNISNPVAVCYPNTIDITSSKIFVGNDPTFKYGFFEDAALKNPIHDPQHISITGSYFVIATNAQGCSVNGKIDVVVNDLPVLAVKDPAAVCYPEKVDLTNQNLYLGSSEKLSYSFFSDEALTDRVSNPKSVSKSGIYYVKTTNASGCYVSDRINVTINSLPTIVLNKPKAIFDYDFIDLTAAEITKGSKDFSKVSYFHDALLTRPIADPTRMNKAGIYYISLQNEKGCSVSAPIELNILPQPKIVVPTAFTPHKETNNKLYPFLVSIQKLTSFKVFNKWGILVYQTDLASNGWDGQFKSKMQPLETFSWFAEGIDAFGGKFQSTGKTILIL